MRKETKLIIILILLLPVISNAQSTASASATVTIVEPVSLSAVQQPGFETVNVKTSAAYDLLMRNENLGILKQLANNHAYNTTVIAANLTINAGAGNVYTLTVPPKIVLVSTSRTERMTADLYWRNSLQEEAVHYGKQQLTINAGLHIENGQAPRRYASQAFDVTVNFN